MKIKHLGMITAALAALVLTACETTSSISGGSWNSIGTISNGNIKVSIDKSSIRKNGNLATFRDKKTVSKMSEERFANTPAYKTAVSEWEIHCTSKTYRLTALQLTNDRGQVVANHRYTATDVRPMSIMSGTITEKQYETVCGKKL